MHKIVKERNKKKKKERKAKQTHTVVTIAFYVVVWFYRRIVGSGIYESTPFFCA